MIKKLCALAMLSTLGFSDTIIGDRSFSPDQIENFKLAYSYGKMIGHEKELMAILNTESEASSTNVGDKVNKAFKRSYGVMQVKLGTYYWTKKGGYIIPLDEKHSLTEEEVLYHLMKNNNFNIYVSAGYFKMMKDICGGSVDKAISGYNRGHCKESAEGTAYRSKVKNFIAYMDKSGFVEKIASLIGTDENEYTKEAEKNFNEPSEGEVYQSKISQGAEEQNIQAPAEKEGFYKANIDEKTASKSSVKNGYAATANSSYETTYKTNYLRR